uniref:Uncharacterized protein n=1 Tax=Anguilla anguilla TaxID=7936 RepID=A0A0E9X0F6_ANGAN
MVLYFDHFHLLESFYTEKCLRFACRSSHIALKDTLKYLQYMVRTLCLLILKCLYENMLNAKDGLNITGEVITVIKRDDGLGMFSMADFKDIKFPKISHTLISCIGTHKAIQIHYDKIDKW